MTAPDIGGRARWTLDLYTKSLDENGDPQPAGYLVAADGAGNNQYVAPSSSGGVFINPLDFGLVGDDSTDDTTAMQDMFDAIDDGSWIVWPPLTFKITSLITITGKRFRNTGSGTRYGNTVIHQATSNTGAWKFDTSGLSGFRIETCRVEFMEFKGPHSSASPASSGRAIEAVSDIFCEEVMATGFFEGFHLGGTTYYSYLRDCFATNCAEAGYVLDGTNNCVLDNCRAIGAYSTTLPLGPMRYGAKLLGGSASINLGTRVIGGSFEYFSEDGILIEGGGPVMILAPYFETQQSGTGNAHIAVGRSTEVKALTIDGAYLQGDGTSGFTAIHLDRVETFNIHGCRLGINSAIGVSSTGNASGGKFWGNDNDPAGTISLPGDTILVPGVSFDTPAILLGDTPDDGVADTAIRSDATIVAFDGVDPVTQDYDDVADPGTADFAARRDHRHGMPSAATGGGGGHILLADGRGTPFTFDDMLQADDGSDFLWSDPA